jgi:nucleolar pre-ribosomal-associated protein 1
VLNFATVSSAHSHLYVLLKANIVAEAPAIRATLTALLGHILSRSSILFEDDPDEPYLWLASIPVRTRSSGIEAPDGASLTDEGDSVIAFLDDCIQRCLKTPYRYLEDMYAVCQSNTEPDEHRGKDRLDIYPSPLLMTVSEQLVAKLANKLLTASDVLAIVTFVRKLVVRLSTKLPDLQFLDAFARRMDLLIQPEHLFPQYPIMSSAIRRELSILHSSLQYIQSPGIYEPAPSSHVVQDFLNQVEQLSVRM